jgi:nucleoid DNA-binding protein
MPLGFHYFLTNKVMTKTDLVNAMADAAGITKKAAGEALDALLSAVTGSLQKGNNVTITGFGTFRVSHRAARTGVNPRNPSQKIQIPAMKVPAFKAGKSLKDAVR